MKLKVQEGGAFMNEDSQGVAVIAAGAHFGTTAN